MNKKELKNYLKNQTITITKGELEKVKLEAVNQAIDTLIPFQLMVLYDRNGWKKKRLKRFHDQFMGLIEAASQGYVNVDDVKKTLKEEVGVQFDDEKASSNV